MRLVIKEYANGKGKFAVETSDDGSEVKKTLAGQKEIGARIRAYVEVSCDNNDDGFDGVIEALKMIENEARHRRTVNNPNP